MEKNDTNAALRAHSRQSILQLIQQNGTISRAELARRLELSRSTVSENIAPLLQCGVLQEVGTAHAQRVGGRRPVLLQIQGEYCYFVAAELGLEQPIFALSDLNGCQLYRQVLTVRDSAPYAERLQQCIAAISTLLRQGNVPSGHLAMIALSSPGAFSGSDEQFLLNQEFENWDVRRLIDDLERHFQTHVLWANDINAATVGEYHQGAGQRVSNLLFMGCGMGIGMGMILDGNLYTGSRGSAGEIARVRVGRLNTPLRTQVEIPSLMDRIRMESGWLAHGMHLFVEEGCGPLLEEMDCYSWEADGRPEDGVIKQQFAVTLLREPIKFSEDTTVSASSSAEITWSLNPSCFPCLIRRCSGKPSTRWRWSPPLCGRRPVSMD